MLRLSASAAVARPPAARQQRIRRTRCRQSLHTIETPQLVKSLEVCKLQTWVDFIPHAQDRLTAQKEKEVLHLPGNLVCCVPVVIGIPS